MSGVWRSDDGSLRVRRADGGGWYVEKHVAGEYNFPVPVYYSPEQMDWLVKFMTAPAAENDARFAEAAA